MNKRAPTAAGMPHQDNNYQLDGADNKEAFFNSWNLSPSVDAIQEFSIQVGQYSAEFGWAHSLLERPAGYVPGFLRFNQDVAPYLSLAPLCFAESFFGAHVRISMVSGIVNGSGIPRGALHSDWPYNQKGAAHVLAPYPDALMHIVTMWMLTDFTPENGGTIVSAGEPQKAVSSLWTMSR